MKKDNFRVVKNITLIIIFILLVIIFFSFLLVGRDNKIIKNIKEYISTDIKVLYISNEDNYHDYPIELFEKYDVNYLYVDSTNLSNIDQSKIKDIINSKYLSNIIVIFNNGEIVDAIIEYEDEESLDKFLQTNDLIPKIIGDNSKIIQNVNELLTTQYSLIYLPYNYVEEIDNQDKILKEICENYEINYKRIDAYLLSKSQQNKLNSILQISTVEDQIVILVKNEKIIGSIRSINTKKSYFNKLTEFKFIDQIDSFVANINLDEFNNLLNSNEKNIIIIGKDDCKYCEEVSKTLNDIAINYDIKVNYINIGKFDSNISIQVEEILLELGYIDGFTTPITLIIENNKLLDYVIGASNEQYFIDIFTENGIIK
ncbi:MAG: hypothetical protein E7174_03460 [Firmicutes bacterium]|nr:hypothetical protein [Bacillota bacterium]